MFGRMKMRRGSKKGGFFTRPVFKKVGKLGLLALLAKAVDEKDK